MRHASLRNTTFMDISNFHFPGKIMERFPVYPFEFQLSMTRTQIVRSRGVAYRVDQRSVFDPPTIAHFYQVIFVSVSDFVFKNILINSRL